MHGRTLEARACRQALPARNAAALCPSVTMLSAVRRTHAHTPTLSVSVSHTASSRVLVQLEDSQRLLTMAEGRLVHTDARARDAEAEMHALRAQLASALGSLHAGSHGCDLKRSKRASAKMGEQHK